MPNKHTYTVWVLKDSDRYYNSDGHFLKSTMDIKEATQFSTKETAEHEKYWSGEKYSPLRVKVTLEVEGNV